MFLPFSSTINFASSVAFLRTKAWNLSINAARDLTVILHHLLEKALFAAVTAALTSVEFDIATLPKIVESEGLIISRYSFVDGGTTSPFI